MDDYSYARYEKFGRVYDFGQANLLDVAGTDAAQHLTSLEAIITQLDTARAGQSGGSAAPAATLLDAVRTDVQNIVRTAHALAQDDPNYSALFRAPAALNPRAVRTAATAILANLIATDADNAATKAAKAERIAKFTANGLPADFATQLQADLAKVDAARESETNADNAGVQNTAAIGRLVSEGMKECHYLDAIFHNVYAHNADKLRAWLSASHLERVPHRTSPAPAPTPTPPAR